MKKNKWTAVLLAVLGCVFAVSIWQLISIHRQYAVGRQNYEQLAQAVVIPVEKEPVSIVPTVVEAKPENTPLLQVDFQTLLQINPDTIAWISGQDGAIDYPVVQGKNNKFYLRHMFDGAENQNGAIFVDSRNAAFTDRNTFIYGHNMNNGAMFASLQQYSNEGYVDAHPNLILVTPDESFYLQPFSGYVTEATSDAYTMDFADDTAFAAYLETIRGRSAFVSSVEVLPQDRIVTLSTCSYVFDEARYVLHCKLIPQ